jgi:GMP synthase (glutamine-hydrolysing)
VNKTAVAIRHVHFEDLGVFDGVLRRRGYAISYCEAGIEDIGGLDPVSPDLIVVLGGPIGAYKDTAYPFLGQELALLEHRLAAARPTIGICLGAQLMARALGERVYPARAKEIGWGELQISEAARNGPLGHFADVPVLHWHGDTFDLPQEAELLASTEICPNQAFSLGHHVLACQFHLEISGYGFERWLVGHAVELAGAPYISSAALRRDTERLARISASHGAACLAQWLTALPP